MLGKAFDVELFKKALIAGARAQGLKLSESKLQRYVEEVAAMDAEERTLFF
jgi:hypothetical protein